MSSVAFMTVASMVQSVGPRQLAARTSVRRWTWPLIAVAVVGWLVGLVASGIGVAAGAAMAPVRHEIAQDISAIALPVARIGSSSELEVRVRHANGRRVAISLGRDFVSASTLTGVTPLPATTRIGPDGIVLEFHTRLESDLRVVIAATPETIGRLSYDLGVVVGQDVSATTPMSQYVLPW